MTETKLYKQTDTYTQKAKKKITAEFMRLSLLGFDILNVMGTQKYTSAMFRRLLLYNRKEYRKIIDYACTYALGQLNDTEKKKVKCDDDMLGYFLTMYNPVTGYLYEKEAERKRLRLNEEILTSREIDDRDRLQKAVKRSADLWYTQSVQYAQDAADFAELEVFKRAGIKKVRWNSEHDIKTCKECLDRDGKVYPINEVPRKDHYHCRCWLTPVR